MSYNTHSKKGSEWKQWGGTGILTQGKIAFYAAGAGNDKAGLGRWTWAKYRAGHTTFRVVSVYKPNTNKVGEESVYAQHRQYFDDHDDPRDPIVAWLEDFETELQEWIQEGDQIVVQGDVNDSVFDDPILGLFTRNNMRNLIFELHDAAEAPQTYFKTSEGRIVDGIWGTPGIKAEQGGYLEPGDFPGNHSLLWIDIAFTTALGSNPPKPVSPNARRLKLQDSRTTEKYLEHYDKLVAHHNLIKRQAKLSSQLQYGTPLTPQMIQEAEAIDVLKTQCMLKAEHKCRKLRMGAVAFSEATEMPRRAIQFWSLAIRRKRNLPVSSRLWRRRKRKANISEPTKHMTEKTMLERLKTAIKEYRIAKKNHIKLRETFIDSFAPKDRDRIKRTEEQRRLGQVAKLVTGKLASLSVVKVVIDGAECTNKLEIDEALLKVNEDKVQSSSHTPFYTLPLQPLFGAKNEKSGCDQVLKGTFQPPPNIDPFAKTLIRHLQRPAAANSARYQPVKQITTDDHIRGWKKAKERTSAGISGLTFAMYKAHIKRRHLAELDAAQRNLTYTTGYAYKRWKKGVDVQLLKRKQDYRAEKLRTILLLEADFNMNNKVMGRDMMRHGKSANTLAKDNYGGQTNAQAVEVSLNWQLTNNSIWARRGRAILISNDAKGCYDRIAHIVASLAMQCFNVPKPALASMLTAIQEMDHHIRTAFGLSTNTYGNDPSKLPAGVLQGNGAGPAIWFAISTALINAMKAAGFGYKQWTMIKKRAIRITCFAFVDDTDLIHANSNVSREELLQEAQAALNLWSGLLQATGGALAPEKSYWYHVEVIYKDGKWQYAKIQDTPGELVLEGVAVKRCEVTEANEALGIQVRPDGSMQDELAYLCDKSVKWSDSVRTKRISKYEAWYSLNSTIMNTIEYPLTATTFSQEEIDTIMKPILQTILPMCGVQRNMPRKLVYGTLRGRGLNIHNPYWTQLIRHLHAIMSHYHRDTPTSDLIAENMELVQLYVGSDQTFWSLPFPLYGQLAPDGWIKHTWDALHDTPLSLQGVDLALPPQREHDIHLMDAFIDCEPSSDDLLTLQNCRLYLEAYSLADITTACGSRITTAAWMGKRHDTQQPPQWIPTRKPSETAWTLWRNYLRRAFLIPHATHTRLRQALGKWKTKEDDHWIWWEDPASEIIYQRTHTSHGPTWTLWNRRLTTTGFRRQFHQPHPLPAPPDLSNCHRISVQLHRHNLRLSVVSSSAHHVQPSPITTATTLEQLILNLPASAQWAVNRLHRQDDGEAFAQAILNGTAIIVSDGSLKLQLGTAAFILEGTENVYIEGVHAVPGPIQDGDSHRCEVSGLFGAVILANLIAQLHNITTGKVTIACDNQAAINIFDPNYLPKPKSRNFDLVNALHHALQSSPFEWDPHHVLGHQDSKRRHQPLTHLELLNIYMDKRAKAYWSHVLTSHPSFPTVPQHAVYNEGWQLWAGDTKVTQPSSDALYSLILSPRTKRWWVRHKHLKAEAFDDVDWDATEELMHKLPFSRRRWIVKHASENCGVGVTLQNWKYQMDAKCPRCACDREDTRHVLLCRGQGADEIFQKSLETLSKDLARAKTDPDITTAVTQALLHWREQRQISILSFPSETRDAVRNQQKIGWKNFLEGLPSKQWQHLQAQYYKRHRLRKSLKRWTATFNRGLHNLAWSLWNHRNDVKHRILKPREQLARKLLDREIVQRYLSAHEQLLEGDKCHLHYSLWQLLQKPVSFKKSWLLNVISAQKWYLRVQEQQAADLQMSRDTSWVLQYIKNRQI